MVEIEVEVELEVFREHLIPPKSRCVSSAGDFKDTGPLVTLARKFG